jgi:hypothetical protein
MPQYREGDTAGQQAGARVHKTGDDSIPKIENIVETVNHSIPTIDKTSKTSDNGRKIHISHNYRNSL